MLKWHFLQFSQFHICRKTALLNTGNAIIWEIPGKMEMLNVLFVLFCLYIHGYASYVLQLQESSKVFQIRGGYA